MNLGLSNSWATIDWANLRFPTTMRIDYVRWYQREDEISVTCDPPGYETTEYIKDHIEAYTDQNLTVSCSAIKSTKQGELLTFLVEVESDWI